MARSEILLQIARPRNLPGEGTQGVLEEAKYSFFALTGLSNVHLMSSLSLTNDSSIISVNETGH